jgi:hypothetical protein
MRTTIHYKDLTKKNGFPSDIDRTKIAVVQIITVNYEFQPCRIMYTNKEGHQDCQELPDELIYKYAEGIYIIRK